MRSDDPRFGSKIVNGQLLIVPDENGWKQLQLTPMIDGYPIAVLTLLWKDYVLVQPYSELAIGLIPPFRYSKVWLPCILLRTERRWQRVHLERLTCESCMWQGYTANPMDPDLYLDVPDWHSALKRALKHPTVPCPCCKSTLPRHPIWTEGCI